MRLTRLTVCAFLILAMPLLVSLKHIGPKEDRECRTAFDKVATAVGKKYGLELIVHGCGPVVDDNKVIWCVGMISRKPYKIDEARAIITDLGTQLNLLVNRDPQFLRYVNKQLEYKKMSVDRVPQEKVGAKITFWDANTDRYQRPYVAQVRLAGDKITFFYADPQTQALVDPIEEPFTTSSVDTRPRTRTVNE